MVVGTTVRVMILVLGSRDMESTREQGVLNAIKAFPRAPITFSGRGKQVEYVPVPQRESSRMLRGVSRALQQHSPTTTTTTKTKNNPHSTPPAAHVLLEDRANNTADNFECSRTLWLKHGITPTRVIVVTNPYHRARAREFAKLLWSPSRVPWTVDFFEDVPDAPQASLAWRTALENGLLWKQVLNDTVQTLVGPCSQGPSASSCAMLT